MEDNTIKFKKKPEIGDHISLNDIFDTENNGAMFSNDRKYRYALWRVWDKDKPLVMFIGLNPSTANEITNDPTVRRVCRFAFDWGFGGVYMMNLFDQVTSDPKELEINKPPSYTLSRFDHNDLWLKAIADKCQRIIFAWGSFPEAVEKGRAVVKKFGGYALGINKDGSPKHPLYVKKDVKPEIYIPCPGGTEKQWTPKVSGKYYTATNSNVGRGVHKHIWEGSKLDYSRHKSGNCFKSKAEANFMLKAFGKAW